MTTQVPWRPGEEPDVLEDKARNTIYRLKRWYFKNWMRCLTAEYQYCQGRYSPASGVDLDYCSRMTQWLNRYGFPPGEPVSEISKVDPMTLELMALWIPDFGARLYGRLDPYTEDKVKAFLDWYYEYTPRPDDPDLEVAHTLSLRYWYATRQGLQDLGPTFRDIFDEYTLIVKKYALPGTTYIRHDFGSDYRAG